MAKLKITISKRKVAAKKGKIIIDKSPKKKITIFKKRIIVKK